VRSAAAARSSARVSRSYACLMGEWCGTVAAGLVSARSRATAR
jgi:hypothetical protein